MMIDAQRKRFVEKEEEVTEGERRRWSEKNAIFLKI